MDRNNGFQKWHEDLDRVYIFSALFETKKFRYLYDLKLGKFVLWIATHFLKMANIRDSSSKYEKAKEKK